MYIQKMGLITKLQPTWLGIMVIVVDSKEFISILLLKENIFHPKGIEIKLFLKLQNKYQGITISDTGRYNNLSRTRTN